MEQIEYLVVGLHFWVLACSTLVTAYGVCTGQFFAPYAMLIPDSDHRRTVSLEVPFSTRKQHPQIEFSTVGPKIWSDWRLSMPPIPPSLIPGPCPLEWTWTGMQTF